MDVGRSLQTGGDRALELSSTLSGAARRLFDAGSVVETLQRIVDVSVQIVDGCDYAGIFVLDGTEITTPVHSDPVVLDVDAIQHRSKEGPCLEAVTAHRTSYADELAEDSRWPRFGPEAAATGIRSVLAVALSANGTRGALNLYACLPAAFGVLDRANGQIFATLALTAAEAHEEDLRHIESLERALVTREMIGQAIGILMERERITADQAFDILRRASQRLNVKLRDVAQNLVDTGERPVVD